MRLCGLSICTKKTIRAQQCRPWESKVKLISILQYMQLLPRIPATLVYLNRLLLIPNIQDSPPTPANVIDFLAPALKSVYPSIQTVSINTIVSGNASFNMM